MGIGQELRGDDAVGLLIAARLQARFAQRPDRYIAAAGPAPEAFTAPLRRFQPQRVILIDAALMGLAAGEWRWLDWRDSANYSASTHSLPLHLLANYLEEELDCTVALLGVQPADNTLGLELSPQAQAAAAQIETELDSLLAAS